MNSNVWNRCVYISHLLMRTPPFYCRITEQYETLYVFLSFVHAYAYICKRCLYLELKPILLPGLVSYYKLWVWNLRFLNHLSNMGRLTFN